MAYSAPITREHPACLIFLLDQSESMGEPLGEDQPVRRADFVADTVNRMLQNLVIRCAATEEVRNYYYVSAIRYGSAVEPAFGGILGGRTLVPISEVAEHPARRAMRTMTVPDPVNGPCDQEVAFLVPIWIDLHSGVGTPMCEGFASARTTVEAWLSEHPSGFPPTVLHVTANESSDGDPTQIGRRITSLSTEDGPVLLFNCHLSSSRTAKIEYPASKSDLPNQSARMLFDISSPLPDHFRESVRQAGLRIQEGAKGFVFNGDAASVVQFLEMGTALANLR
ncbi:MAG: VWA domain-containing protein [Gemmatimonadetes bacterium]|nr:VWA domain-containing protein [Gemmatimonadota bacterium]